MGRKQPQSERKILTPIDNFDTLDVAEEASPSPQNINRITVIFRDADKAHLQQLKDELSRRCRRPISQSRIVRWAIRHCDWSQFEAY